MRELELIFLFRSISYKDYLRSSRGLLNLVVVQSVGLCSSASHAVFTWKLCANTLVMLVMVFLPPQVRNLLRLLRTILPLSTLLPPSLCRLRIMCMRSFRIIFFC